MSSEKNRSRIVHLLLRELLGKEVPPDISKQVLERIDEEDVSSAFQKLESPSPFVSFKKKKNLRFRLLSVASIAAAIIAMIAILKLQGVVNERTPELISFLGEVDHGLGSMQQKEVLSTGDSSCAVLTYKDGTTVRLDSNTTIMIPNSSRWDTSKRLLVLNGGITASVEKQSKDSPMILMSERADVKVVGTDFSFRVKSRSTRLDVSHGSVIFAPKSGKEVLVETNHFCRLEISSSGVEMTPPEKINGIVGFTLMDADLDQPIEHYSIENGAVIPLSDLPTKNINIRADHVGDRPASVTLRLTRQDGSLKALLKDVNPRTELEPPYFLFGDAHHSGRPKDSLPWTPVPGDYTLTARSNYEQPQKNAKSETLRVHFRITE